MDNTDLSILIERVGHEAGKEYVYIIGAAAIIPVLSTQESADTELVRTRDIDIIVDAGDAMNDRIAFIYGEGSSFDEQYGIYAEPVDFNTPSAAPDDWQLRALPYRCGSITALCMAPHDLALSKYGAGREKDLEFTAALVRGGHLEKSRLLELLPLVPGSEALRETIRQRINKDFEAM